MPVESLFVSFCGLAPARATNDASRLGAGVLAVTNDLDAVDEDVGNTRCILMRLRERRPVPNGRRVENDYVGEVPGLERSAPVETKIGSRKRGQTPDVK